MTGPLRRLYRIEVVLIKGGAVTLEALSARLLEHGAAEVRTVVFLEKPDRRETEMRPDYVGLQVPDQFVVGYGLDYDGRFGLPLGQLD